LIITEKHYPSDALEIASFFDILAKWYERYTFIPKSPPSLSSFFSFFSSFPSSPFSSPFSPLPSLLYKHLLRTTSTQKPAIIKNQSKPKKASIPKKALTPKKGKFKPKAKREKKETKSVADSEKEPTKVSPKKNNKKIRKQ
jgi:hypothetical protein